MKKKICIIGAGLAGSELSYQLAKRGLEVCLYEPRLNKKYDDGIHKTDKFAELVCSNSFRSNSLHNAAGLLKEELRLLGSFIISTADRFAVPAGSALAVSRDDFASAVTKTISSMPNIKIIPEEVTSLRPLLDKFDLVVVCAGPVTSKALSADLMDMIGKDYLYFYDAIAPLVEFSSVNMEKCFRASRYSTEDGDYVNAPMTKKQYEEFVEMLLKGEKSPLHKGDEGVFFRGCLPVEFMAEEGMETLLNGPMRGDGLMDPQTGRAPYAAVQLRQDNAVGNVYNIVGFQTRLTYPEQERVFRSIPGLEKAEFLRLGSMHRNIYVNAPEVLNSNMSLKVEPRIFLSGQISGVEGYVESIAHSMVVANSILNLWDLPSYTATGALRDYLVNADPKNFQPMKINFGIIPPLTDDDMALYMEKGKRRFETKMAMSRRSIGSFKNISPKP